MLLKNTRERFGLIAKSFHWIMAVLILMLLTMGYKMGQLPPGPDKVWVVMLHKSLGVLVLMLAFGRLAWRFASPRPGPEPTIKPWEEQLSRIVHFCLYAAFFLMPLSGWIMSAAGKYPVSFFGLFDLPQIVPKSRDTMELARTVHDTLAVVILVLLFLHFSGAAKHHAVDRDNTLRRMTWMRMRYGSGIVLLALLGAVYLIPVSLFVFAEEETPPQQQQPVAQQTQAIVPAGRWIVDSSASYIHFEVVQSGQPFDGEFKNFTASIDFDPETATGNVDVQIPVTQMTTGTTDRDQQAVTADWFDAANFPMASFKAESFERLEANQFVAHGTLTIRGVSKTVDLPFTLDVQDGQPKTAEMKSEISLNRLDFGIGQGEWQKTDTVADAVKITLYVKATLPVQ